MNLVKKDVMRHTINRDGYEVSTDALEMLVDVIDQHIRDHILLAIYDLAMFTGNKRITVRLVERAYKELSRRGIL